MTSAHAHLSHVEAQRRYCNGVATGEEMEIHHRQKRDQRDGSSDARATPTNGDVITHIPYPLLQTPLLTRLYTNVFCASPVIDNSCLLLLLFTDRMSPQNNDNDDVKSSSDAE